MTDNEITQIARKRRVNELIEAVATTVLQTRGSLEALVEFGVDAAEAIGLALDRIKDPALRQAFEAAGVEGRTVTRMEEHAMNIIGADVMGGVLDRLFSEAPKLNKPDMPEQAPAFECVVTLPCGSALHGAISRSTEGALRMLAKAHDENNRPILVEHFFDVREICVLTVRRDVAAVPAIWPAS